MEQLVEEKMTAMKERIVVEWDPKEAREYFQRILFD